MSEPAWLDEARSMRAEIPRRTYREISERLDVSFQTVTYWLQRRVKERRSDRKGPGPAGRKRLSDARRGIGNPNYQHGYRMGENDRAGTRRFKSPELRCLAPDCLAKGEHEHHVIYRQVLRKRGLDEFDPRNAMKLCVSCHSSHHRRGKIIPTSALLDRHIEYAFEVLGIYAMDYLRRYYDDAEPDPRIVNWSESYARAAEYADL